MAVQAPEPRGSVRVSAKESGVALLTKPPDLGRDDQFGGWVGSTTSCPKTQPGSMSIVRYGSVPGHIAASSTEIRQFPGCS